MTHLCPVCGYPELVLPPTNHMICPSCGTEFDYDDYEISHDELRQQWIAGGATWWSEATPPPPGWNPIIQLLGVIDPRSARAIGTVWEEANLIARDRIQQAKRPREAPRSRSVTMAAAAAFSTELRETVAAAGELPWMPSAVDRSGETRETVRLSAA